MAYRPRDQQQRYGRDPDRGRPASASYWRRGNRKARSVEVLSGLAVELVDEGEQGVRASCSGDDHE